MANFHHRLCLQSEGFGRRIFNVAMFCNFMSNLIGAVVDTRAFYPSCRLVTGTWT